MDTACPLSVRACRRQSWSWSSKSSRGRRIAETLPAPYTIEHHDTVKQELCQRLRMRVREQVGSAMNRRKKGPLDDSGPRIRGRTALRRSDAQGRERVCTEMEAHLARSPSHEHDETYVRCIT